MLCLRMQMINAFLNIPSFPLHLYIHVHRAGMTG